MEEDLSIEIICLGPVLEGSGAISSELREAQYEEFGEILRQCVERIQEKNCTACKDGRKCLQHADGTEYKVRARVAGGSATPLGMMGLGDRNFVEGLKDTTNDAADIYKTAEDLSSFVGNEESAHTDCGAIKGLPKHARAVHAASDSNANVAFVRKHMQTVAPHEDIDELIDNSRSLAAEFAEVLEANHYDGEEYIGVVTERNPHGVEQLEVDGQDPNHGHAEQAVVIVFSDLDEEGRPEFSINDEKLAELAGGAQVFTVNYDELCRQADRLGNTPRQKAQLLSASLLHHLAGVYGVLCDGSHPVYLITASQ